MLSKLKRIKEQRTDSGFTIIEVMIVLAIAGLILLIVLLAVPAVQRNARNTTLKNDVGSVAGGISTYESDNNGTAPTNLTGTGTITLDSGGAMACSGSTGPQTVTVNGSTTVKCITTAPGSTPVPAGTIQAAPGQTCGTGNTAFGTPSARSVALFYSVETSSGLQSECSSS